jgi:hypothetical protein
VRIEEIGPMQWRAWLIAITLVSACATPHAPPLERSDPHVAQMFNLLRRARADGDMDKLDAALRDMGRAHAIEWGIDQAASEKMILATAHKALLAAEEHPENLASLDAFNRSIGAR